MSWEVNQDHENQMQMVHNDKDKTTSTMDIPEEKKVMVIFLKRKPLISDPRPATLNLQAKNSCPLVLTDGGVLYCFPPLLNVRVFWPLLSVL